MPTCEADHTRIEELYRLTSPGPSEADRAFVDALTDDYLIPQLRQMFPARFAPSAAQARWVLSGLQRHFLGAELADDLGIPDTPAQHLLPVLRPALTVLDRGTLLLAGGRARAALRCGFWIVSSSRSSSASSASSSSSPSTGSSRP